MTKLPNRSPLACTAIAAVLAAVSTPTFAQDTVVPEPAPAPAPAPAASAPAPIVLPEFKAAPVVQPAPAASAAPEVVTEAKPVPAARTAPRTAARTASVSAAAAVPAPAQPAPVASPVAAEPARLTQAAPEPGSPSNPDVKPVPAASTDQTAEIGLGLLGLVALGGIGAYAAARGRRPEQIGGADYSAAPAPLASGSTPAAWTPATAEVDATAAPFMFERNPEGAPAAGGRMRSTDMIPAGPLPTGPALADLFERMVNAAPDKDNPFKSDKRRRARVRWLMKQHEYRLADPDGLTAADRFNAGASGFDFRTYTPSTKRPADEGAGKEVIPA